MQALTEKFIFISREGDEVSKVFSRKIVSFHEQYSSVLILSGLGEPDSNLDNLEMVKSPELEDDFFGQLIYSLQATEPLIISTLINNEKIEAYLSVFYVFDDFAEGFYLLQQIEGWGGSNKTSYQVWELSDECNLYDMYDHWDFIV
jgi:hypothetical protein